MNQKDYKEIAGVISKYRMTAIKPLNSLAHRIANDLADYFERKTTEKGLERDTKALTLYYNTMKKKDFIAYIVRLFNLNTFDRKQFLKDCGVK